MAHRQAGHCRKRPLLALLVFWQFILPMQECSVKGSAIMEREGVSGRMQGRQNLLVASHMCE